MVSCRHDMPPPDLRRQVIAGIDETGRGAGAAEVYAAAVILDPDRPIDGLADSKKLTAQRRETLSEEIKHYALCWSVATASVQEVEELNILQATLLAMRRAAEGLSITPDKVLVDGNRTPQLQVPVEAIVRGDATIPAISAASILAKVARDAAMVAYDVRYPEYGFAEHKGYLTKEHLEALLRHGPCPIHRKTYGPIRELLEPNLWGPNLWEPTGMLSERGRF